MRRATAIVSLIDLVLLGFATAVGIDISLHGALITGDTERYPGPLVVVQLVSFAGFIGIALMLVGVTLGLVLAAQRHEWVWFAVILVLLPAGIVGFGFLAFEGALGPGIVPVLVPLVTLAYAVVQVRWRSPHPHVPPASVPPTA